MQPLEAYPLGVVDKSIQSPYGWRTHPVSGERRFHTGVDIGGSGDVCRAVFRGTAHYGRFGSAYGKQIILVRGDGSGAFYAHMSSLAVEDGEPVNAGERLGPVGATGTATGPHLHFQLHEDWRDYNSHLNPEPFLRPFMEDEDMPLSDADKTWIRDALTASEARTWNRLVPMERRLLDAVNEAASVPPEVKEAVKAALREGTAA